MLGGGCAPSLPITGDIHHGFRGSCCVPNLYDLLLWVYRRKLIPGDGHPSSWFCSTLETSVSQDVKQSLMGISSLNIKSIGDIKADELGSKFNFTKQCQRNQLVNLLLLVIS